MQRKLLLDQRGQLLNGETNKIFASYTYDRALVSSKYKELKKKKKKKKH